MSDIDEAELARQLQQLEDENREVDGDDDADEYEDGMGAAGSDEEIK